MLKLFAIFAFLFLDFARILKNNQLKDLPMSIFSKNTKLYLL